MTERTWQISDLDGSNKRTVTLAQYRAEVDAAKQAVAPVAAAWRRGDLKAVEAAQKRARQLLKK